jgi:glyoxylase-like metal-dependent hydrolase (beta-lactamase superfamily II)
VVWPLRPIAPDLWRLRGLPPNAINVYLAGDVLIDAATRLATRRILRQIQDRPLSLLCLTHVHPDHQGAARSVCEARGIPLACHADDVDAMEGRRPVQEAHSDNLVNRAIERLWQGPSRRVDRVLSEGDRVGEYEVVHAPGHARGEIILFRESDRVAICGDVIRNLSYATGLPRLDEPPGVFTLDPAENRRSIRRLLELRPAIVCPGHGPPLTDPAKLERLLERFGD